MLVDILTNRENEVLDLILRGRTGKEIGLALSISHRTVEVHRENIRQKLGARTLVEVAVIVLTGTRWTGLNGAKFGPSPQRGH